MAATSASAIASRLPATSAQDADAALLTRGACRRPSFQIVFDAINAQAAVARTQVRLAVAS